MLQLLAASMLMILPLDTIPERDSRNDTLRLRAVISDSVATSIGDSIASSAAVADSFATRATSADANATLLAPLTMRQPVALTALPDTAPQQRRAVVYSEWYGRRLTIHRIGSYTMLPLFLGQYLLGSKLLKQKEGTENGTRLVPVDQSLRDKHKYVAAGIGTLFVVNGATGAWNLWASRKDPSHRTLRYVHAGLMFASEAGFILTGIKAKNAVNHLSPDARTHRNFALGSMALATTGVSLMWFSNRD